MKKQYRVEILISEEGVNPSLIEGRIQACISNSSNFDNATVYPITVEEVKTGRRERSASNDLPPWKEVEFMHNIGGREAVIELLESAFYYQTGKNL